MNQENEYTEGLPNINPSPRVSYYDGFVYLTTSPKARPYLEPQRVIRDELSKEGFSEDYRKWLIEQNIETAREIERNTPPDNHPYLRVTLEIGKCCAVSVTLFTFAAACHFFFRRV